MKDVHTLAGPKKTVFGSVNFNLRPERSDTWPVPAAMTKWDRHWMQKWFYIKNPYPVNNDKANSLRFRHSSISIVAKPNVEFDGTLESRLIHSRLV